MNKIINTLVLLVSILPLYCFSVQQTDISINQNKAVKYIDTLNVEYISLNDFLKSFNLSYIISDTTDKIEFLYQKHLIKVTNNNPFIILTERFTNNSSVYQMLNKPYKIADEYYIPFTTLANILEKISNTKFVFNKDKMSVEVESISTKYDIAGIQIEKKTNGSLITILANKKLENVETWLKKDGWLFVTISSATADTLTLNSISPMADIKKVIAFQSPTSIQLTFQLSNNIIQAETITETETNNVLIALRAKTESEKSEENKSTKRKLENDINRWKLDAIVIDAGHGGKDPGAIGVSGVKEKDITLGVALKLGRLIKKHYPDMKVLYTRETDEFVELYKRTEIANKAGAKLFISIHCNAIAKKPSKTNGFEIYLLRPNRTEEAVSIAAKENEVIKLEEGYKDKYKELTEEAFIIITMAQSAYMKYSELFAECSAETMSKYLTLKNGGVKQAGFYVLVGASMPNALIEIGYLSNKKDENFLRSYDGQMKIAESIFYGIKKYKLRYEDALKN